MTTSSWLGRGKQEKGRPARTLTFGEQYRPIKIEKFVYGVPKPEKINDFAFDAILTKRYDRAEHIEVFSNEFRVFEVIERHAEHKPSIVFCATRRDVLNCAKAIATDFNSKQTKTWNTSQDLNVRFRDKDLNDLAKSGIGFHHAGLDMSDRLLIEKLYLKGAISVIVATSTLAVGVNLPAHLVVLKNTLQYVGGSFQEYSDIEVLQMSKLPHHVQNRS